ncbi:MAG: hypothetical protein ACR2NM_03895 [Bythopirellula sp.]
MNLAAAARLCFLATVCCAILVATHRKTSAAFRDVQFLSIDFETEVLELFNFGNSLEPLDGWRFCTHDEDQVRRYSSTSGLNGVSIGAGDSLFIHFANDAPAEANDALNIDSTGIGGAFALPFDQDAYGINLYINSAFGSGAAIADHVQWSIDGVDNNSADERSDEAESGGVWTDQSEWVATTALTQRIELTDLTGGILHGPGNYLVVEPATADFDSDGDVDGDDFLTWQDNSGLLSGATLEQGDANGDGAVNDDDLQVWNANYGQSNGALVSTLQVPEPSSSAIAIAGTLCFGLLMRRAPGRSTQA